MSSLVAHTAHSRRSAFRHEALVYAGMDGFLDGTVPFIEEGAEAGEPTLVIVSDEKIALLRRALGRAARHVAFADMGEVGVNPARLIPAWREFVEQSAGSERIRGIGEPIWADRSPAELIECQRHEALLNLAFADDPPLRLLCPYDTETLSAAVIQEAYCSHPHVVEGSAARASDSYRHPDEVAAPFATPLPEPAGRTREIGFHLDSLAMMRRFVSGLATEAGLSAARTSDLVLAVNELATNSVRHADGHGTLRAWLEPDAVVCEVHDGGRIDQPLAGRRRPGSSQIGGHGLWLVNQVCELVQVRCFPSGSVVRVHMRRA